MNYKEVKFELKKEFDSFLKPLGYKPKNELQGCTFIILKNNIQYSIGYGIASYIDEFTTACFIGIGIYKIQQVEKLIFYGSYYETLSTNMSEYFNKSNYSYRIKTIGDIKEWGKIVKKFYEEYVVLFYERYNTINAIDKLLNDKPTERTIYKTLESQINTGLIAAKLNNNPKYDELRDYYRSEVESKFQGYFIYAKCMKVIDFLDKYTSEELNKLANEI